MSATHSQSHEKLAAAVQAFIGFQSCFTLRISDHADREGQRRAGQELLTALKSRIPGAAASLTHTENQMAAVAAALPGGEGIGIDMERADREISPKLFRRFRSPGEDALPMRPIAVWCAKEACYKANSGNAGTVVQNYRLTAYLPSPGEGEPAEGFAQLERTGSPRQLFRFALFQYEEWVIAVAITLPAALSSH